MQAGFSLKQTTAEGFNNGLPNDAGAETHLSRQDAGLYFIRSLNLHLFLMSFEYHIDWIADRVGMWLKKKYW